MSHSKNDDLRDERRTQQARREEDLRAELLNDPDSTGSIGSQDSRRRHGDARHDHENDRGQQYRDEDHADHEDYLRAKHRAERNDNQD